MSSLSERMLDENRTVWDAMQAHRFVRDVEADRLPEDVFHHYLVIEGAFVATAIGIFAQGVIKAPGIRQQRWLIGVLRALAEEQIGYFERTYAALEIDPAAYDVKAPQVEAFRAGMERIASEGSYLDIVTAMFAAEWMYWHWCRRAAQTPLSDPELKRWVDLHAEDAFAAQAKWLKAEVDAGDATLNEAERVRLSHLFGHVLQLEVEFHSSAYGTP